MGLKVHLQWFDKKTEDFIDKEYSVDLGDDDTVITQTVNPTENIINNGWFDVISACTCAPPIDCYSVLFPPQKAEDKMHG